MRQIWATPCPVRTLSKIELSSRGTAIFCARELRAMQLIFCNCRVRRFAVEKTRRWSSPLSASWADNSWRSVSFEGVVMMAGSLRPEITRPFMILMGIPEPNRSAGHVGHEQTSPSLGRRRWLVHL